MPKGATGSGSAQPDKYKVFIGMPAYLGTLPSAMEVMHRFASKVPGRCCTPGTMMFSNHCGGFNALLATAFNVREEWGLTHLVIQHQDVTPEPWYVDKGLEIMERDGLDVLAAAVPIKDEKMLTSVAALDRETLCTRRMSLREVHALPPTFTSEDLPKIGWKRHLLLPVAGLFFLKLDPTKLFDARGNSRLWFESPARILRDPSGTYVSAVWDEGWNISVQMLLAGMKVGCTREIALNHVGGGTWSNQQTGPPEPWDTDACQTDQSWILGKCPVEADGTFKKPKKKLVTTGGGDE